MTFSKRYHSVSGEIFAESINGIRTDYMSDALGSVTGTCDSATGAVQNTYRYKPFGTLLTKTGVSPDPKFQYVGTAGYRSSTLAHSNIYVRARHYSNQEGLWTTVDPNDHPISFGLYPYSYVNGNPITRFDPTGRNWEDCPEELRKKLNDDWVRMMNKVKKKLCPDANKPPQSVIDCWKHCGDGDPERSAECMCKHGTMVPGYGIKFICRKGALCQESTSNKGCQGRCMCTEAGTVRSNCKTSICLENCTPTQMYYLADAYFHELLHCCNSRHEYDSNRHDVDDTKGVPGPGGIGANTLCLLKCLRPLLGAQPQEPWVNPPTTMACHLSAQL